MQQNGVSNNVVVYDELRARLMEAGFDYDIELMTLDEHVKGLYLPHIRIEHRENGKHRMYFDLGEGYLDRDSEIAIAQNKVTGVVVFYQQIRALWREGEVLPTCSAINDRPNIEDPVSSSCIGCPEAMIGHGKCKPKIKLLLLTELEDSLQPVVFTLSPTSIKNWNAHLRKLKRAELPPVAVNTVFTLKDIKKNGYRWAEVEISIDGFASIDALALAEQIRSEFQPLAGNISESDFSDPGDRSKDDGEPPF